MRTSIKTNIAFSMLLFALTLTPFAHGGAVINPGFAGTNTLAANDDGSTGLVSLGFAANFFGTSYTDGYVNNNGNLTFTGGLNQFTPQGIKTVDKPMIAPFFADVDTRGEGSGLVTYGSGTLFGQNAFAVEWPHVGYYRTNTDKLNSFELILVSRPDTGVGNFDIYFNYDQVQWETGDASGGRGGLGGTSAGVGYTDGSGPTCTATRRCFELLGSLENGALIDGGSYALVSHDLNSSTPGRYIFPVRNGVVTATPEPGTLILLGSGILGLGSVVRRKLNL